jgi:DNA-binding HxlR family transcriptional regulator
MASAREYGHFCPAARALEVVGERWTLLVVRDLLAGEQRFSDLQRSLGGIAPKQLTLRLRELEAQGLLVRDQEAGRREVRYRLTNAGRDLAPVVDALTAWGVRHAARPPRPGEQIHPRHLLNGIAATLNGLGATLPVPRAWTLRFVPGGAFALSFDGTRWAAAPGEGDGSLVVETAPEALAGFIATAKSERRLPSHSIGVEGDPGAIAELRAVFGAGS